MESLEIPNKDSETFSTERSQLIHELRSECEQILNQHGEVKGLKHHIQDGLLKLSKTLGIAALHPHSTNIKEYSKTVNYQGQNQLITVASSAKDPSTSEFITIKSDRVMNQLVLSKNNALLLENWNMGESVYYPQTQIETTEEGTLESINPAPANVDDMKPYSEIIAKLVSN